MVLPQSEVSGSPFRCPWFCLVAHGRRQLSVVISGFYNIYTGTYGSMNDDVFIRIYAPATEHESLSNLKGV
jgi:hypothetical protein